MCVDKLHPLQPVISGVKTAQTICLAAVLLCTALVSACQANPTLESQPTPQVLTVQVTPALQSMSDTFRRCTQAQPNTGLVLLDTPAASIDLDRAPLALRWGAGASLPGSAAVVGQEELVIVVNPQNPAERISLADLQAIYHGTLRAWPGQTSEIQPWAYASGEDIQSIFEAVVLGGSALSNRTASTAPDPAAVREAVAGNPAAIGFLPKRWVDKSIKVLPLDGMDPANLRQPILALSKSEPKGLEKAWLICLQEQRTE